MANLNNTMCNCEGFYNAEEQICEPLQTNSPDPCPPTFWGSLGDWAMNNITIGGVGGGYSNNYQPQNSPAKDNTLLYVVVAIAVVAVFYFALKKK